MSSTIGFRNGGALAVAVLLAACGTPVATAPAPTPSAQGGCSPAPGSSPADSPSPQLSPTPSPAQRSIEVSLSAQHLWAYEGQTVVISTDVTTGMPALPTPAGSFHITAKYSPYRFISPWPKGSPYYYDPLDVDYAMLFAAGGYFIHDAWWQRNFGPGGNLKTGSHGCINVPSAAMAGLYEWTQVGDLVVITQ